MKSGKLLDTIGELLERKKSKQAKHVEELKILLEKLKRSKKKVEGKIQVEKDAHKLDRLRKELEVIKAKQAKGERALKRLG